MVSMRQTRLAARLGGPLSLFAASVLALAAGLQAAESNPAKERMLYVPMADLPLLLNEPNERVFMTRTEYRELEAEAGKQPPDAAPRATVLLDADYDMRIEDQVGTIRGRIELEVLTPGLHKVPLNFQGVTLRAAQLDNKSAPLGRTPAGQPMLFVGTPGRHQLDLQLQTPVVVAAAQQSLQFQLPTGGSTTLNLSVPGNIEVKSGAVVATRHYDPEADETRFELVPESGGTDLVMSLNNRRLQQEKVVVARSVLVSELTSAYERIHLTAEMRVLHGAADQFRFDVPAGVQVTEVTSPLTAEWVVRETDSGDVLDVMLREPTRDAETLRISANRAPVNLDTWSMPRLQPQDISGYVAVVGLIAEARLQPLNLTAKNLIRLDTRVLRDGLPASVFDAEPGAPAIRPLAAYYAPDDNFQCSAALKDPRDELRVGTHMLLSLSPDQQTLDGGFTLTPQASKLTTFAFQMPGEWRLDKLSAGDKPLSFDCDPADDHVRYVVELPETVQPGGSQTIFFEASHCSSEWLTQWDSKRVQFPRIDVEQATEISGAIALQTSGDLRASPVRTENLVPLDAKERGRFGLADSSSEVTYEITGAPYQAAFLVRRKAPKISTRNYSFFQIRDSSLSVHHEVVFQVERAHAHQLKLSLPDSTPAALSIQGLDGLQLKEYARVRREGRSYWTVLPASPLKGSVHLAIDYVQRWKDPQSKDFVLPLVRAADVAYQSQIVSIEGDPSLDIGIQTDMRPVDIGELVEARYAPGPRLLGTFASTAGEEKIRLDIARRQLQPLPAAIVKRAELVTQIAASGISQSCARYQLHAKTPYLAIELPEESELWSVTLGQTPIKPRRQKEEILLSLQTEDSRQVRDLQVVYQTRTNTLDWLGRVRARAPQLRLLRNEHDRGALVPQVDLVWHVVLPSGYSVSRERGTVFSDQLKLPRSPFQLLARATTLSGGGVHGPPFMLAAPGSARRTVADASAQATMPRGSEMPESALSEAQPPPETPQLAVDSESAGGETQPTREEHRQRRGRQPTTSEQPAEPHAAQSRTDETDSPSDVEHPPGPAGQSDGGQPGPFREPGRDAAPEQQHAFGGGGMAGGMGGMGDRRAETTFEGDDGYSSFSGFGPRSGPSGPGQNGQTAGNQQSAPRASSGRRASGETPPANQSPPGPQAGKSQAGKYWALQGLRGLAITIDRSPIKDGWSLGEERTFRSLGTEPVLDITVFRNTRMEWLALGVAAAILCWGLILMRRPVGSRVRFVLWVAVLSCAVPVLGGATAEFVSVFEHALFAALILIPLWIILSAGTRSARWVLGKVSRVPRPLTSAMVLTGCLVGGFHGTAHGQVEELDTLLQPLLQPRPPIRIPDDAVVIPYDPDSPQWQAQARRVLVPYERYVTLWNRAHPNQKLAAEPAQPAFAFAGANYQTTLQTDEHILLTGTVEIAVFSDQPVEVPLALDNAVVTSARLDGEPARFKASVPRAAPEPKQQQQAPSSSDAPAATPVLSLMVAGKGNHRLELSLRVATQRRGGWRRANATIPHAEATAVELNAPRAGTTVRRALATKTLTRTTETAGETLPLGLPRNGRFDVSWRAEVSPGSVDQALTARSTALVDVRENGVGVVWQVSLSFGQRERGLFELDIPSGYVVEQVSGGNVRGWDRSRVEGRSRLTVELLKAVKKEETIVLHLSRRSSLISATKTKLDTPIVSVPDAALHRGILQIRRSPILALQTVETAGVSRAEGDAATEKLSGLLAPRHSPLAMRQYQAYQFSGTPFRIRMSVSRKEPEVNARLRTILRIGETESSLESEIWLSTRQRDLFLIEISIPPRLELKRVAANGLTDWSLIEDGERPLLRAFFAAGQPDDVTLSLNGQLSGRESGQPVELPHLEVLNVARQRGHIVVQVDPSLQARAAELEGCREVLLKKATGWLNSQQRSLARLALEYEGGEYAGQIQLSRREPQVSCNTITNVRVTYRDIQETILLDFEITRAGVRRVRFRLPVWLRNARISAPRVRQKTVSPVEGQDEVQVELDLQDAVTGQYRVVVENDRALTGQPHRAPLPAIDVGTVNNRYVTLENVGRDELLVDDVANMEPVARGSREWKQLTTRLPGGDFATAYIATTTGPDSTFVYRTKRREQVATAGATIGLARTVLVVDPNGAYRASMLLKIDNRTEPYLEIELPDNAELWTAHVAGNPVKPAQSTGADDTLRRIPLIKTEEGDLDYDVVLKYAGQMDGFRFLRSVHFPIILTKNITTELSQIKLYLPEAYRWFQFDGTATQVSGEEAFKAGFVSYQTRQLEELAQTIRSSNQFSQSRAIYNVDKLGKELKTWHEGIEQQHDDPGLKSKLESNRRVLEAAERQIRELAAQKQPSADNRTILNQFYEQQDNELAKNRVNRLGSNFAPARPPAKPAPSADVKFNAEWFMTDRDGKKAPGSEKQDKSEQGKPAKGAQGQAPRRPAGRLKQKESYRVQQQAEISKERDAAEQVFQQQLQRNQPAQQPQQPQDEPPQEEQSAVQADLGRAYQNEIEQEEQKRKQQVGERFEGGGQGRGGVESRLSTRSPQPASTPRGLSSLDFPLPKRGKVFHFTTPDPKVEITARPVKRQVQRRFLNLASLLVLIAGVWIAANIIRYLARSRIGRTLSVLLLAGGGLLLLLLGAFPLFGCAMFLGSVLLAIDWRRNPAE